jgi:hypothetical protein
LDRYLKDENVKAVLGEKGIRYDVGRTEMKLVI